MMDIFSKNAKYLRKKNGLTQAEMIVNIGIEPTTWSNYERGKSFPNLELFHKISKFFGVSESDLLNVDLAERIPNVNFKREGKEYLKEYPSEYLKGKTAVNEPRGEYGVAPLFNVYDFATAAAAGEAMILLEKDKYSARPNMYIPDLGPGVHIRTPVRGDSMHSTIKDGDKLLLTMLSEPNQIREGYVHVLIDRQDGMVCKRVYMDGKNQVELVSDNEIYKPYKRSLKDILYWFKVVEVHTSNLRPYWNDLRAEMRAIRQEMADFRRLLKR